MPSRRRREAAEGIPAGCAVTTKDYYRTTKKLEDTLRLLIKKKEVESEEGQARKQAEQLRIARLMKVNKNVPLERFSSELDSCASSNFSATSELDNSVTSTTSSQHSRAASTTPGDETPRMAYEFTIDDEDEETDSSLSDLDTPMLGSATTAVPEPKESDNLSPEMRAQLIASKLQFKQRRKKKNFSRAITKDTQPSPSERPEGINMERAFHYLLRRVKRRLAHDKSIHHYPEPERTREESERRAAQDAAEVQRRLAKPEGRGAHQPSSSGASGSLSGEKSSSRNTNPLHSKSNSFSESDFLRSQSRESTSSGTYSDKDAGHHSFQKKSFFIVPCVERGKMSEASRKPLKK